MKFTEIADMSRLLAHGNYAAAFAITAMFGSGYGQAAVITAIVVAVLNAIQLMIDVTR